MTRLFNSAPMWRLPVALLLMALSAKQINAQLPGCPPTMDVLPTRPVLFVGDSLTCSVGFIQYPNTTYEWMNQAQPSAPRIVGSTYRFTNQGRFTVSCIAFVAGACSMTKTVTVNVTVATSCAKIQQVNPKAPSGRYTITTTRGQMIEAYCEMGLNGGGYTFLSPQSLPDLTDAELQALFTDRTNFLMRTQRCDGMQYYGVLKQLPEYSYVNLALGLNAAPPGYFSFTSYNAAPSYLGTPFLVYSFLPTTITSTKTTRGLQVNGVNVSYEVNTGSNHAHQFLLLPGFAEKASYNITTATMPVSVSLFSNTKPNPSGRRMPEEYFMFFELYFIGHAYANTYAQFNTLCIHTATIGFR